MAVLVLGLVIFLGLHSTRIFAERGRAKAIARLGEGPWKGVYSVLSLIGFALIIWGFGQARWNAAELWTPPIWTRHTTILLMLFSLILIGAYIFKKSHIAVAVHHPMVWGVAIWAAGHLIANGSAADVLLFGAFLVWAAADLVSSYSRDLLNAVVYPAPNWGATIGAVGLGVVLWIALLAGLHHWLFGVSPMAGMPG
ncbi:MAG TPA: NnrU family protein [Roseiarcus sp.]|nr:NnrU family protein [Roseiarcus sp.]